jgi:hypothetical protein
VVALEAMATDTRCIRGPKCHDDYGALEEVQVEPELRARETRLRRTQVTVPGFTAISSVA